jgi:hypothetical protein
VRHVAFRGSQDRGDGRVDAFGEVTYSCDITVDPRGDIADHGRTCVEAERRGDDERDALRDGLTIPAMRPVLSWMFGEPRIEIVTELMRDHLRDHGPRLLVVHHDRSVSSTEVTVDPADQVLAANLETRRHRDAAHKRAEVGRVTVEGPILERGDVIAIGLGNVEDAHAPEADDTPRPFSCALVVDATNARSENPDATLTLAYLTTQRPPGLEPGDLGGVGPLGRDEDRVRQRIVMKCCSGTEPRNKHVGIGEAFDRFSKSFAQFNGGVRQAHGRW